MVRANVSKFQRDLLFIKSVGLDTMCFLYHFADHPRYSELTECLFTLLEDGKVKGITSTITIAEAFVHVETSGKPDLIHEYELAFINSPNIEILPIDWRLARLAAKVRAQYPLIRTPDALQISATLLKGYGAFVTNDENFKRVKELRVLILDDYQ